MATKAIIFDCFGVLITDSLQAMRDQLARHDVSAADEVKKIIGLSNRGVINPMEARPLLAEQFGLSLDDFVERLLSGEVKNYELMDYIAGLRKKYKTGILSNIGAGSLRKRFDEEELELHFDAVVASGEIGYSKPTLKAYEIAAQKLGVDPSECIFTDDRYAFCQAAQEAGMKAIVFEDFSQFKRELELMIAE